jgi:hypothetical protein
MTDSEPILEWYTQPLRNRGHADDEADSIALEIVAIRQKESCTQFFILKELQFFKEDRNLWSPHDLLSGSQPAASAFARVCN